MSTDTQPPPDPLTDYSQWIGGILYTVTSERRTVSDTFGFRVDEVSRLITPIFPSLGDTIYMVAREYFVAGRPLASLTIRATTLNLLLLAGPGGPHACGL
ncbi:MAG TPA: hypothetical protein VMT30_07155 [Candidatus Saccharimonadia bacterium]|nr:hypothetical protein [Candidatus Saccharimonadia bacterium]